MARSFAIFADPDCPYCRRLEGDIRSLTDVTVYTFVFPMLNPASRDKAIGVWCAPDRAAAWNSLVNGRSVPGSPQCEHPIDRNIALARQLRVTGTPTLVAADGRKVAGALDATRLVAFLDQQPSVAQVQK